MAQAVKARHGAAGDAPDAAGGAAVRGLFDAGVAGSCGAMRANEEARARASLLMDSVNRSTAHGHLCSMGWSCC